MSKKRITWLIAPLALFAVALLGACGGSGGETTSESTGEAPPSTEEASSEPLVIGVAFGLTGECAPGDAPALEGIEYQVDQINAAGGLNGQQIELISKDMQSKPALAGRVTEELIDQGADVILGPCLDGNAIPTAEAATSAGVPVVQVTNTNPLPAELMDTGLVFFTGYSDNVQAAAAAEYALEEGQETALLLESPDIGYTSNTPRWFGEAFEHGGGEVVDSVTYSILAPDFSSQVTQIANVSPEPEVIYSALFMPDLGIFVPQLRAAGVESALLGADAFDSEEFIQSAKGDAEGIVFTSHGVAEPGTPFAEFIEGMTEANGKAPEAESYAMLGAVSVELVQKAVEQSGSTDPATIAKTIAGFEDVEMIDGTRTYAGTDGTPKLPIVMAEIKDGKNVAVATVEPKFVPAP